MNRVVVIVLNWNGADDAMRCIASLSSGRVAPDIILVDNHSSDNSVDILDDYIKSHPEIPITFIKNLSNSGFAGGNNVAIRHALNRGYEYIGSLNPDATAEYEWLWALMDELDQNPDTGVSTGLLIKDTTRYIDTCGEQYTTWGIPGPRYRGVSLDHAPKNHEYIFGATGGSFLARSTVFRDIGLFDEKFFMYFEDVDLCFRAQLAGYKIRYTPKSVAHHKINASSSKVPGLIRTQTFKNLPVLFLKNVPIQLWPQILPRFFLAYTLFFWHAVFQGQGRYAILGWLRFVTLVPYSMKMRRKIQGTRRVNIEYIDGILLHDILPNQTGLRKFRNLFTRSHH